MFYVFKLSTIKKIAGVTLLLAILVLLLRFFLIPEFLFPRKFSEYVEKFSEKYHLEVSLVYAVIKTESNFNEKATSNKDAKGLMQISDVTGAWGAEEIGLSSFHKDDLYNPEINIEIGCWYLEKLLAQFDTIETALAAYNAGSGNVSKWLKDTRYSSDGITLEKIPFKETERFVERVLRRWQVYKNL